ncbi:DUF2953 domain-containing protein [Romboutsia sp. 1001713B170131_170501_G6]|uniref:DUF2953 domain-containing protein n=1 Tax=Romboutsia sp. 1001713B170131_170501_G6 TaxID=2787108 RepID=UPI0018AA20C8|nr:DUF2953 domain-containing protein [Romboutsia sp. 1001713B170131_170501_G6]
MRYSVLLIIFIVVVLLLILFISKLNILITSKVKNEDIKVDLRIKYFFNIININIPLYPTNKKCRKNKKGEVKRNRSIYNSSLKEIKVVFGLLKRVKIEEIYININFGNENIPFTSFIYVFINFIYSSIINIIDSNKVYLNVKPDFTKNFINCDSKIEIKPTIKDIIIISIAVFKIYIKINKGKRNGGNIEIDKLNKNSYGDNI